MVKNSPQVINWPERLFSNDPHWPDQHYENAVAKNTATGRRYKAIVRIVKKLRIDMADAGVGAALSIPGFLVECLVWNTPNEHFGNSSLKADVRAVLAFLFNNTRTDTECSGWTEVSGWKWLFYGQKWTRNEAHEFISAAWSYLGLE